MPEKPMGAEDRIIAGFGYRPQFKRVLSLFADFSLGFSCMAPVGAFYGLFGFALATAGPAYFWTLPVVLAGQALVALVFAEAASQYPIAGSIYQWSYRLVGPRWGFLTAFMYLAAMVASTAAAGYVGVPYVASLLGCKATPGIAAAIAMALILAAALINFAGTKVLAKGVEAGVWAGLAGLAFGGVYLLLFGRQQPIAVLFENFGAGAGNYTAALFSASLIGMWIFYGFEACGDLGEEVIDASHKVPRAIMLTVGVGGACAIVLALGMTLAVPDMAGAVSGQVTNPAEAVLLAAFGPIGLRAGIVIIVIVVVSAATSFIASTSRLLFSMARDQLIFGHRVLATIDEGRGLPRMAIVTATIAPCLIVLIGVLSSDALTQVISFATAGIYTSFVMMTGGALYARIQGWKPTGVFTLAGWGMPVNILALAFGIAATANLVWPRSPDVVWYLNYINLLSLLLIFVLGLAQLGNVNRADVAR